jgi:hypothetical protein
MENVRATTLRRYHWLPWITLGVVALACGIGVTMFRRQPDRAVDNAQTSAAASPKLPPAITEQRYESQLMTLLAANPPATFFTAAGAATFQQGLLAMERLPASAKGPQISLALAASHVSQGRLAEARTILQELARAYPWLSSALTPYLQG